MRPGTHPFVPWNISQASLELVPAAAVAVVVAASKFSQCIMLWGSFSWAKCSGCQRFDSGALFLLDGERRREGKKKEKRK
jgi:hypothetical protein